MKTLSLLLSMCWASLAFSQGTTCSNATIITVDGIARSFPVSTSQGACGFCTMSGYSGNNGRITYFRFTTDNQPQCVLIDVTASTNITMEMMLYDVCNSGVASPAGGLYNHNMCMNEGLGIWAQNLFDNLSPNTTYYLKVRTEGGYTGNIQVSAKYHTPANLI
jgi:hypothetical protein